MSEFKLTTNATGQVTQVTTVIEDGNLDFVFEYDKNNAKKVMVSDSGVKETLL